MTNGQMFHYVAGTKTLCGRGCGFGALVTAKPEQVECKRCRAKLAARDERRAAKAAQVG